MPRNSQQWPKPFLLGIGWFCLCTSLTVSAAAAGSPRSQPEVLAAPIINPESLLKAWLSLPDAGAIDWEYAYIATDKSVYLRENQRAALLGELARIAQTQAASSSIIAPARGWARAVRAATSYRVPGYWGAAHLMAYPERMPPIQAVSAVGYCEAVPWVEIWDAQGVHRVEWQPQTTLSSLRGNGDLQLLPATSWIQIILPWGEQRRVGVAPWNYKDEPIAPGMRIVAPLRTNRYSGKWLNRALPDFLAHVVTGDKCRRSAIEFTGAFRAH